jgi:hypothetical protein
MVQGEVAEQGVDRGEAVVAGGGTVASLVFEMIQERGDQRRVESGDIQVAGVVPSRFDAKVNRSRKVSL